MSNPCPHKTLALVLLLFTTGCAVRRIERHIQAFNQRCYDECVKKHGGENWTDKRTGLPLTCKPLTYPACEPDGRECHQ